MRIVATELPGVVIVEPQVFGDARGFFLESWNRDRYSEAGLPATFVQDNVSLSARGVVRGLHYQHPRSQGKLISVLQGEVYDVAVDIRRGSPHFGRWVGVTLSSENKRQVFVPAGFAHGFCVTSDTALFMYKCTELYAPEAERGIAWNDPQLNIPWPVQAPILSPKDEKYPRLREIDSNALPA
jgi:dTDP-4-dehydrorhamnose 3,5-epimerase